MTSIPDRVRRAWIPATRAERVAWTDLDYMCEIADATDTGHQQAALALLAEMDRARTNRKTDR